MTTEKIDEKIHVIGGYSRYVKLPLHWAKSVKKVKITNEGSKLILEIAE